MKFNLDKDYFKISIYAALTLTAVYILFKVVDSAAFLLINTSVILDGVKGAIGYILSVFSVLIMAFVISYILDPSADFFQKQYEIFAAKHMEKARRRDKSDSSRMAGTIITYAVVLIVIAVIILFITLKLKANDKSILQAVLDIINNIQNQLSDFSTNALITLSKWGAPGYISDMVYSFINAASDMVENLDIVKIITTLGSSIMDFIMAAVVAFYFLKDKEVIVGKINDLMETFLSDKVRTGIINTAGDIHAVFSGYIRGQLTDALIMGILISIGLSIAGLKLALIIGILSGIANFIPYFGAVVGFFLSVAAALLEGNITKAIIAGAIVFVLQQIDGMFIVPKIVGEKVELSPVLVLLSLSVAGSMFGITGMIFAVPICAIIKVFLVRFMHRYKKNRIKTRKS